MVSGALAVLTQAYSKYNYNSQDLAHVLFATAENLGAKTAADNAAYGYGMADNGIYGYGLIRLDRAIAGPKTLAAGSAVDVGYQQMTYWSQPLTTAGGFSKTGAGYLIVAGRTTAQGDVNVNAGALGVDGTLTLNTQATVAQNATLAGFGWINGNVAINGTLNAGQLPNYSDVKANNGGVLPVGIPLTGTSPGTLTFNGNVTLGKTANTRINIDGILQIPGGPGTYDKLIVTGANHTFAENGVLTPVLSGIPGGNNNYTPQQGDSFVFLMAVNGASVTGSFTGVKQPFGLKTNTRLDVVDPPGMIAIDVTPLTFDGLAVAQSTNANEQAIASALDRARPAAGLTMYGRTETIFDALYAETVSGDVTALAALSGQGQAAAPGAILDAFAGLSGAIADRQELLLSGFGEVQASLTPSIVFSYAGAGPVVAARSVATAPYPTEAPPGDSPWTTWGQGYGRAAHVGEANGIPGATASSGAFVIGADRSFSNDLVGGGAVGYTRTALSSADTSATADTYAGALYATWAPGRLVFDGRLAAGPTTGGSSRAIAFPGEAITAAGSLNGWGGLAAGDAGYLFEFAGASLKPFVGLTGQSFNRRAFTETTDFGLSFPSQTFNRLTSEVGVWATTLLHADLTTYMLQLKLSWTDDFASQGLTTQAALLDQPFMIAAANPGRDAAVIGVNLAAWQTENVALFARYTGEFRNNANSQQGAVGLRMTW
jgi:autotransporter-associated beta strand protein